jgi:hypothetical protein
MHASRAGADSPGLPGRLPAAIPSLYGMPGGTDYTGEHLTRLIPTGCVGFSPQTRY